MTSSKKRTYLALMSVGAAALFVDRCVLTEGTPAPASAEEVPLLGVDAESQAPTRPGGPTDQLRPDVPGRRTPSPFEKGGLKGVAAEELSIPELPFPRNLNPYDPSAPIRDIFMRPPSAAVETADQAASDSPESAATSGEKQRIGRAAFAAQHRLDAIMIQQRLKIAILDGRWMQVGDVIDGCTLFVINGESAVFRCRDGDALLSPFERTQPGDH